MWMEETPTAASFLCCDECSATLFAHDWKAEVATEHLEQAFVRGAVSNEDRRVVVQQCIWLFAAKDL